MCIVTTFGGDILPIFVDGVCKHMLLWSGDSNIGTWRKALNRKFKQTRYTTIGKR